MPKIDVFSWNSELEMIEDIGQNDEVMFCENGLRVASVTKLAKVPA